MKIKGFDKNLCCRGMQFEIGKTYETGAKDNEISLCSNTVFHYCDSIQNVHQHYSCNPKEENRFCEIEVLGAEVSDKEKCGSNKIRIVREIVGDELKTLLGMINGNTGLFNTGNMNSGYMNSGNRNSGDRNSGDWNSGDWNSGNRNSGDRNSGDWNSGYMNSGNRNSGNRNSGNMNIGDMNSGDWNSGYMNSGNRNSGNRNSGNRNSGNRNSGNRNSGDWNSGDWNSGYMNSGNRNSGDWNSCNDSNGIFCNEPDRNIRIFNQPSGMSLEEFRNSFYYGALVSVPLELTRWDEESKTLKERSYKEACAIWWNALTEENKEIIQQIPNFDCEIFFDITGIDLRGDKKC